MRIVNRKARFKYQVLEKVEAGIVLSGAEIKSIRAGRATITDSFARIKEKSNFQICEAKKSTNIFSMS